MKTNILIFAGFCAGMMVSFQNCTKASYGSKESGLQRSGGTGTGNGYDGKIYAILSSELCPDKSNVEAAILVTESQKEAYLIRESCESVQAQFLAPQSYQIVSENEIEYKGVTYTEIPEDRLPGASAPTPQEEKQLLCYRKTSAQYDGYDGQVQLQLYGNNSGELKGTLVVTDYRRMTTRQSSDFTVSAATDNQGGWIYSYRDTQGYYYLKLNLRGEYGYGSYKMLAYSTDAPPTGYSEEIWNGMQPFTCRRMPW